MLCFTKTYLTTSDWDLTKCLLKKKIDLCICRKTDFDSLICQVIGYLKNVAPELCKRVELYDKRTPIFDEYKIEEEINGILSKRCDITLSQSCIKAKIDVVCTMV